MSKKDNFNQAMYDMFGVGKDPGKAQAPGPVQGPESTAADLDAAGQAENMVPFPNDDAKLRVVSRPVTYLAPGTRVEGTLRSEGSVEIDGEFKGDITAEGNVIVRTDMTGDITALSLSIIGCCLTGDAHISEQVLLDAESSVNGNIIAGTLNCSGTIIGDLDIQRNMTLEQGAKVVGSITAGTMTVARGAIIRGNVETRGED